MTTRTQLGTQDVFERVRRLIGRMPPSMISALPVDYPAVQASPEPIDPISQSVASQAPCRPCEAFNKIAHITGLVEEASNSCTPEGLPRGVGGTIQVAAAECDDMIKGLANEPAFSNTTQALRTLRPLLSWVGTCEDATAATEAALAARRVTHQDAVMYFRSKAE